MYVGTTGIGCTVLYVCMYAARGTPTLFFSSAFVIPIRPAHSGRSAAVRVKKRSSSLSDVEDESLSLEDLAGGAGSGWVAKSANSWSRSIAHEKASAANGDKSGEKSRGRNGPI